jgi:hypothetical protein
MLAQDRLQHMLVAGRGLCRADVAGIRPCRPAPFYLRIGEVPGAGDAAALLVAGAFGADFRLEAEPTEDLHAARRDAGKFILDGSSLMPFDEQRAKAVIR